MVFVINATIWLTITAFREVIMLGLLAQLDTTAPTATNGEESGVMALMAGYFLFILVWIVVSIIGLWKVFEKAGVEGWKAVIPIYNVWVFFEIAGKPGWWALVGLAGIIPILGLFASIAAFVLYVIAALELGKAFGKSTAFSVVGLVIFSAIGFLILGFGDAKYTKPKPVVTVVK